MQGNRAISAPRRGVLVALAVAVALTAGLGAASSARAASPTVSAAWAEEVTSSSVRFGGEIDLDPALGTTYRFEWLTEASYDANVEAGLDPFDKASVRSGSIAPGPAEATVGERITTLRPETAYRYRLVATNSSGLSESPANRLITRGLGGESPQAEGRGWEMVSPIYKGGGQVDGPGEIAGGGVLQAAADGNSVTYSSAISFAGGEGAPPGAQYISRRGSSSWSTENITTPMVSGSYDAVAAGVPYQLFSDDLARGLLLNGQRCREGGVGCAVANPPLPGSGAPTGYQNYYLRDSATASFRALVDGAAVTQSPLSAAEFEVRFAGASADLNHVVLATCAKLTPNASEVAGPEGCDPQATNLYRSSGGALSLINVLPGDSQGTPGAALAAQAGAISADGSRVYFIHGGTLYLRQGETTQLVAPGGEFQTASSDGAIAFYTSAGHLYRYEAATGTSTDLTPAGEVVGVLGASPDGSYLYYQTSLGLFMRHQSTVKAVAPGADAAATTAYPPTTATARISADGTLIFLSEQSLTGFDNVSRNTGQPVTEVFRYDPGADQLACLSCHPTGERPIGASRIPGAIANGTAPGSTHAYRPRAFSSSGDRVFFESQDDLVSRDTNGAFDVYQWEAPGTGSCAKPQGCVSLISSGKSGRAFFVDASASGDDVFFRTNVSLVASDFGAFDLYDARVGGGFPEPPLPPIPCVADACQSLPSAPVDPVLNTLNSGAANPPVKFFNTTRQKPVYHRLRNHRHKKVRRGSKKAQRGSSGGRRGNRTAVRRDRFQGERRTAR